MSTIRNPLTGPDTAGSLKDGCFSKRNGRHGRMKNGADTLRVACLGAGYFAQFHYDAWRRCDRVRLVGACDSDRDRARSTGLTAFGDLDCMLKMARPDLLDIITPPQTHREAICKAIDHGVRAVICQKPFCTSLEEAQTVTEIAEGAGVTIVIHENFRFQPWYRTIRQALQAGLVGDVLQLTFRLRTGDGRGRTPISTGSPISRRCRNS